MMQILMIRGSEVSTFDYTQIFVNLVKHNQELQKQVDEQATKITELEEIINKLKEADDFVAFTRLKTGKPC